MFRCVTLEARIPDDHPLRSIRAMTDTALRGMSRKLGEPYSHTGRPSIPPEQRLRALVVQVLFSVRSERLLVEQLHYNLLFRWLVGLQMDDRVWEVTVSTKNRDRLLRGDVAQAFFAQVIGQAREAGLLSDEHFTVDGTLLEACAGHKSFRPKDADGGAGGDKGYDQRAFADAMRKRNVTPHVAQNETNRRSAIDGRTTRHAGYGISPWRRKAIEQSFGWTKTIGLLHEMRHRGIDKVGWAFTFTAAVCDMVRMRPLVAEARA